MPPKKDGSKKGTKKRASVVRPANPPGITPGGLAFKITTTSGTVLEVQEIQFATVASLKLRIAELSHYQPDMMHLFVEAASQDGGLPVAQLHGFSPSWQWPADKCIKLLHDHDVLSSLEAVSGGSVSGCEIYLLTKLAVLKDTAVFVEADEKTFVKLRQAAQLFCQPLLGRQSAAVKLQANQPK